MCEFPSSDLALWSRRAMLLMIIGAVAFFLLWQSEQKQSKTGKVCLVPQCGQSTETAVGRGRSMWWLLI